MTTIWDPIDVGTATLPHRLAMAPMTRNRSTPDGVPTQLNAEYYAQRASTALIVTEGTQPSEDGQGYMLTPGIHTPAQIEGWRTVTEAVHEAGGRIFIQLMHVGRIAHPDNTPHGRQPVAPSPIAAQGDMFTAEGPKPMPTPRELTTDEVAETVADFAHAARSAIEAGADGVEIHGANGYLVHQFLASGTNHRDDVYGGFPQARIRFAVEAVTAVVEAIGAERTGLRISPGNPFNDIAEDDVADVYSALVTALAPLGLAYLHVSAGQDEELLRSIRRDWPGVLLLNRGGRPLEDRFDDVRSGVADVVTIGAQALANPDLVARIRRQAPLNEPDAATFYGGDHRGYTDYPTLPDTATAN